MNKDEADRLIYGVIDLVVAKRAAGFQSGLDIGGGEGASAGLRLEKEATEQEARFWKLFAEVTGHENDHWMS